MDLLELRKQYSSGKRFKYLYFWGHTQKQLSSIITKWNVYTFSYNKIKG